MKVLVTGASGYIGKQVVKALNESGKHTIVALSSRQIDGVETVLHNGYSFDENYLASQGCGDVDALIHLGAFIHKITADADNLEKSFSNIANTRTLLASKFSGLKKIIYISSIDVYKSDGLITEALPPNPSSMYGLSKLYCERMAHCWAKERGVDCLVLRLGHVYGPGDENFKKVIPNAARNILLGKPVQIYNGGKDKRSFIFIEDVAKAIVNALEYKGEEAVINVTGNEPLSISQIIDLMEKASGKAVKREFIESGALPQDVIFDSSLVKKTLLPEFTTLFDGLKKELCYMSRIMQTE